MISRERMETELGLMGGRVKRGFINRKENLSNLQTAMSERTRRAARKTDYYVHDNAWTMMAVTAGLAFVAGLALSQLAAKEEERAPEVGGEGRELKARERRGAKKFNSWEFVHSVIPLALFAWKALQPTKPLPEAV